MITTAKIMDAPSNQPYLMPCMKTPKANESIAAPHKIFIVSSSKVANIISVRVRGGFVIASLVPNFCARHSLSVGEPESPFYISYKVLLS